MSAQDIAQNYLIALVAHPLLACSALSDILDILEDYGPDEREEAKAAVAQYYADNGLAVDQDTLSKTLDTLKSSKLAFWAGVYHMPHPDAGTLRLSILGDTVTLACTDALKDSLFSVPYAAVRFEDQTLSYEDDKVQFSARLWYPGDLPENAAVAPLDMAARNEARLTGTLRIRGDQPEGPYALAGKRGVYTAAGFSDPGYGDPAPVWAGRYQAQYVDGDFSFPGTVALSVNADGSMALALGDLQAAAVAFANNTVVARLPHGAVIALQLVCAPSGARSFTGAVEADGITRCLVGTCPVLYAGAEESHTPRAASDAAPGFCDTHIDQVLTLAQLGAPVEPLKSLSPVPVVYADGSPGTIVVTPTRAGDVYRVPPGAMVAYRPPASAQGDDDALQVAWQLDAGYTLLRMIEPAYYQLRVSLSDAQSADRKGIDIAMGLDAAEEPGFLSLVAPTAATCGLGTGGADSPVKDFTIASVLLANAKTLESDGVLNYLFALSGKSTSPDNAAGDHDGFLCATLTYNTADGRPKYPPRQVRVPLLCAVSLPVTLAEPLAIEGMAALPAGYPNRPASATLSATGGVQPIAWTSTSAAPDGLAWSASKNGASFTLSGKLGALPKGRPVSLSVSAQSDRSKVVSSIKTAQGALPVSSPPATSTGFVNIGWIAGAIIFCGGAMALDAAIRWEQIDPQFVSDYIAQKRLMLAGQDADFEVIFDRRVIFLAAQLKEAISEVAEAEVAVLVGQVREGLADLQALGEWRQERLIHAREAIDDGDYAYARQIQDEIESLRDEMTRMGEDILDLTNRATAIAEEYDRLAP
ncbi:MAG: hypothetical protein EOP78_08675 [Variovorax sp.]|nr:MAG: hypothetical protein EOP78_08675 [Variovorax sp.]